MEQTKIEKLVQKALQKAEKDHEFRKTLIANPIEATESVTGETLKLPSGKELVIIEEELGDNIIARLQYKDGALEGIELNEEELEKVAGGIDGGGCIIHPY